MSLFHFGPHHVGYVFVLGMSWGAIFGSVLKFPFTVKPVVRGSDKLKVKLSHVLDEPGPFWITYQTSAVRLHGISSVHHGLVSL